MLQPLLQTAEILDVPAVPDGPRPEPSAFLADSRPKVRLPGYNYLLSDTASEVGTLLHDKDIFRRGGLVFHTPKTDLEFLPMNPETFRTWCEQHLLFFKVRPSPDGHVIRCMRTMSGAEAEGILAAPQFLGELREVERFNPVRMPVRRKSGEIVLLPEGYDAESLSFTASAGVELSELSLEEARTVIETVLREFSFNDNGRSKAVVVAAMLTVSGIGLLPPLALPPAFIYLANREGAGKTLLAKVCTVPVLGYAPTAAWPKADEEMDKRLLAAVMGGLPVLILDNVRNHISSGPLELFLTNSHFKGRILGQSKEFVGRKSTVVFLTGNGATVSPDMRRRALFAELFLGVERAEDRTFKMRLEAPLLLRGRARILSALWSLIRSWDQAGRPKPSRINSGFSDWSEVFGGIVEHAGFGCALETPEIEGAADTDLADMRALVERIGKGQHQRSVDFAQLVAEAQEAGLFTRLLPEEGEPGAGEKPRCGSETPAIDSGPDSRPGRSRDRGNCRWFPNAQNQEPDRDERRYGGHSQNRSDVVGQSDRQHQGHSAFWCGRAIACTWDSSPPPSRYLCSGSISATKPPPSAVPNCKTSVADTVDSSMFRRFGLAVGWVSSLQTVSLNGPGGRKVSGTRMLGIAFADMPPRYHFAPLRRAVTSSSPTRATGIRVSSHHVGTRFKKSNPAWASYAVG